MVGALDARTLAENLAGVRERIADAARRANRPAEKVRLMAVTKGHGAEVPRLALENGIRLFGENRVQEAEEKYAALTGRPELHLIGHLQRNKASRAAELFDCVQSIDAEATAAALNRAGEARGKTLPILLEYNTSGEPSKFGFQAPEQLLEAADRIKGFPFLRIRGLMTVGPFTGEERTIRRAFILLRELYETLRKAHPDLALDTLSMGMSGDYQIAVEEGANLVRIGTAIFGPRG